MIIPALKVRPSYTMRQDEAQMVLDFEALMASLGLQYYLQCRVCYPSTNLMGGTVDADFTKDGPTYTLKLSCACSSRVYQGDGLTTAKPPEANIMPRDEPEDGYVQDQRVLTRPEMFVFDAMDQLLTRVFKMRYWMRCMRCMNENQNDGVRGRGQSTSGTFVVECDCTRRVYAGHDAPAPVQ